MRSRYTGGGKGGRCCSLPLSQLVLERKPCVYKTLNILGQNMDWNLQAMPFRWSFWNFCCVSRITLKFT